ncbi:hypothetical protein STENM327S_08341 [Streptomyces tendae]
MTPSSSSPRTAPTGGPSAPPTWTSSTPPRPRPRSSPASNRTARAGWAPGATGPRLLSTVARDAIELLTGPHADRVRECGAHNCYLLFVDTSRPGRRRWCAMEHCGNREKVRAHRARRTPDEH